MSKAATQVPIGDLITMLDAISHRDYALFSQLESSFVTQYGLEVWGDFFNFRLLPALDHPSSQWLLLQFAAAGVVSVKNVFEEQLPRENHLRSV
jgi:hypothetical protein